MFITGIIRASIFATLEYTKPQTELYCGHYLVTGTLHLKKKKNKIPSHSIRTENRFFKYGAKRSKMALVATHRESEKFKMKLNGIDASNMGSL